MSDMEIIVGMSMGIPNNVSGLLPSPGHPVSGLAMARMMTSGEEFLDGEDEVVLASMSMVHLEGKDGDVYGGFSPSFIFS